MSNDPRITANVAAIDALEAYDFALVDRSLGLCSLPQGLYSANSDNLTLTDGAVLFVRLPSPVEPKLVTHMEVHVGQTESATETDQRLGLYRKQGTNLVRLGLSGASTTLLETDDVNASAELGTHVWVGPNDELWGAVMSDASTAGTLVGLTLAGIGAATETPSTTSHPVRAYTLAGQNALDASEAISGLTISRSIPWMFARFAV